MTLRNVASKWRKLSGGRIKARYVSPFCVILHKNGEYPEIGEGTWIGHFTVIDGSQGLKIGKNCSIASGVHIYTHSTHELVTRGKKKLTGSVKIGDNVAIGANAVVHYGSKIGDNVVIRSLSLIKPFSVVDA